MRRGSRTPRRTFDSLERFYADPRRRRSRERDVGLHWRAADGRTYRAALVLDTGELYSFEHVSPGGDGGVVKLLARISQRQVDELLAGWRAVCGTPGSYEWLCGRAARA